MLSLTQFLTESTIANQYGVLLDRVEFDKIPDINKLTSLIKEGLIEANSRYKILRIEAIEKLNEEERQYNAERFQKALEEEEKWVIAHMQHLSSVMKRSEAGRQKYINSRLEKFKNSWRGPSLKAVEYDEDKIQFDWHNDVHTEHSYVILGYKMSNVDDLAKRVAEEIISNKDSETWSHLIGINIAVDNNTLTNRYSPQFHIIPMFDEETEKTLSDEIQRFSKYMNQLYDSGRYMGD